MSLLADLLSKSKRGSSHNGDENPPVIDIPPTLSKARGIPARVSTFNKRYAIIAVVSVVFIVVGVLVTAWFGLLSSSEKKKFPPIAQQATPFKAGSSVSASRQVGQVPPLLTPPAGQPVKARITLEEPSPPVPQKKKPRPTKVVSLRNPPKPIASHPVQKVVRPIKEPPAQAVAPAKIDTGKRDALLYAARSSEQTGDWRSALAIYQKAQKVDPDNYKIMSNVAAALNNLGMFDEGIQEAEKALVKKPDYVPALINAAIGHSSRGNVQKALRYFTYASALDPSNRSLVINLGILHERAGSLNDGLATYRQLADAGDPMALHGMARIYERKGSKVEAARAYRQIMALPNATPALKKEAKERVARLED